MIKKILSILCALCLLLSFVSASAQEEGSKGMCYRITGGKNEMVLLGSIHIGNETMYPMGSHITDAIEAADTLVFECDTESPESLQKMMKLMMLPTGEKLQDKISPETYAMLEKVVGNDFVMAQLNGMQPWAVMSSLSLNQLAAILETDNPLEAQQFGVETQVLKLAGEKERAYLETIDEQLVSFGDMEQQEFQLRATCEEILDPEGASQSSKDMKYWPQWWIEGTADAFAASYTKEDPTATPEEIELGEEFHTSLVTNRNIKMAKRLSELLEKEEKHSYFVTIGLLHCVLPEDSVVYELEKMGYQVEQIGL